MIESWSYVDLVKAHRILVKGEGRFKFYTAYMDSRKPNAWLESAHVPLKETLLLFGWVHSWDPNYSAELLKFLTEYESVFPVLKHFEDRTILNVELTKAARAELSLIFDAMPDMMNIGDDHDEWPLNSELSAFEDDCKE